MTVDPSLTARKGSVDMYSQNELLPVSALQHLTFCERRCALIFIERVWADNRLTVEGKNLHERVHAQGNESRGDLRIARGVALNSFPLGLVGVADVVEFHRISPEDLGPGVSLPGTPGLWRPFPVDYKRGKARYARSYEVQLCAQALCLEEMLKTHIPAGAVFSGARRRRLEVTFDANLRLQTENAARRLHQLFDSRLTPAPEAGPKCKDCSLIDLCLPKAASGRSASSYLRDTVEQWPTPP